MAFWKMIKEGYDHFEVTHQEPKVDFCEKKYVFDAAKPPGATNDPVFNAAAKCPAYVVPDDIAEAVRQKQQDDEAEYAKLVAKGTPVAKLNTGIDGGMNQVFASKVPGASTGLSEGGDGGENLSLAFSTMPGTIPGTVNPPRAPDDAAAVVAAAPAAQPAPVAAPAQTRVASASPSGEKSEGFFASLARKVGIAGADTTASAAPPPVPAKPKVAEAKPLPKAFKPAEAKQVPAAEPKPAVAAAARPPKPSVSEAPATADSSAAQARDTLMAGAQPMVSSNSFESRFSAMK
jgi:hypothetical protein